tara:strand:- start:96 stop:380 length:285 start_codon:yes stop_codon:yes gene_type:complete
VTILIQKMVNHYGEPANGVDGDAYARHAILKAMRANEEVTNTKYQIPNTKKQWEPAMPSETVVRLRCGRKFVDHCGKWCPEPESNRHGLAAERF